MVKKTTSLHDLTVKQLRAIATRRKVTLRSQARKVEIISMLQTAVPTEQLGRDVRKSLKRARKTARARYCRCVKAVKAKNPRNPSIAFPICRKSTKVVGAIRCKDKR